MGKGTPLENFLAQNPLQGQFLMVDIATLEFSGVDSVNFGSGAPLKVQNLNF